MQIYIHVPFCKSKCAYCDFNSYSGQNAATVYSYFSALEKEIVYAGKQFPSATVDTVYIGGGTPSLLDAKIITDISSTVKNNFHTEISEFSVECNPESVTEEKLAAYRDCGVNRISVGVQSLDDANLRSVGRVHTAKTALSALETVNKYFDNVSADIIIGLPFDTPGSVAKEIETAVPLIKHLSMYELSLEEGTPLYNRSKRGEILLPDDDELRDLFDAAITSAGKYGFKRYEISNFAADNYFSRHNYGYWTRKEYLGFGAGAHSFIKTSDGAAALKNALRYASPRDLNAYIGGINCVDAYDKIPRVDFSVLSSKEEKAEEIMLGLRTSEGISVELLDENKLNGLQRFFVIKNGKAALNDDGMAVMNSILIEFI